MKTISIFILVFVSLFMHVSCLKYSCDGYDIDNKTYVAFREGDLIVYESNNKDTMVLYVDKFYADGPSSFRGLSMGGHCYPDAYYSTNTDPRFGISIREDHSDDVSFCGTDFYRRYVSSKEKIQITTLDSIQVNGITLKHATEYKDLKGTRRITDVVKAYNYGIVRFYDTESKLTWTQLIESKTTE